LIHTLELESAELAAEVRIACGYSHTTPARQANAAGFLFEFNSGKLRSISTNDLAKTVAHIEKEISMIGATELEISARSMRRNLATYLANMGICGDGISFFLGHNSKLNLWGAASHSVPFDRIEAAKVPLEQYLIANSVRPVDPHWVIGVKNVLAPVIPSMAVTSEAFEGKKQISDMAGARARAAILRVVDLEEFEERGIACIDNDVYEEIKEAVHYELGNDAQARDKVLTQLRTLIDRWRCAGKLKSSSALINLTRFKPSPVAIPHGRYLTIANHVTTRLDKAIIGYLKRHEQPILNQIAVIAVLLIITEAVLNVDDLKALVTAIQDEQIVIFKGQIRVRASVETRYAKYERTCDLTDKCAAAVIGYKKLKQKAAHLGQMLNPYSWEVIAKELNIVLRDLYDGDIDFKYKNLMDVMRPYWMLRLPGAVYACCIGDFNSSAESKESTRLLLGTVPSIVGNSLVRVRKESIPLSEAVGRAVNAVNAILSNTKGKPENKTSNKRASRAALRQSLNNIQANSDPLQEVASWAAEQSIVEIWLDFMRHLLAHGGPIAKTYAHGSLTKYQALVIERLFSTGWNGDLRDFKKSEDYDTFYDAIYIGLTDEEKAEFNTVFKIFHNFLRGHIGAPRCKKFPTGQPRQRTARNVVLSQSAISKALDLAHHDGGPTTKFNSAAAGLIAINAKWGLRVMEGIGLTHRDIVRGPFQEARVKRNTTRYVKTRAGTRRICVSLDMPRLQVEVNRKCLISETYGASDGGAKLIFADPEPPANLIETSQVRSIASWAIKESTGDATAIVYSLRHTWATAALASLLIDKPVSPIAQTLFAELPSLDTRELAQSNPAHSIYSLGIDRVAMWMGHASIDQVIPTYGHCIWWVCSDFCFTVAHQSAWSDETIATLLRVPRTSYFYYKSPNAQSLADNEHAAESKAQKAHAAISHYANEAGFSAMEINLNEPDAATLESNSDALDKSLNLSFIEKLFDIRAHHQKSTFDNMGGILNNDFGIPLSSAEALVNAYTSILKESKFKDFEPAINKVGADARTGILQTQKSRRELLFTITKRNSGDPLGWDDVARFASEWVRNVDHKSPRMVFDTVANFISAYQWLLSLGYKSQDLTVSAANLSGKGNAELNKMSIDPIISKSSLSRHDLIGNALEIGIQIDSGTPLPTGRDFQRVMFALAVWDRSGLLKTMASGKSPKKVNAMK
jgi:integrase